MAHNLRCWLVLVLLSGIACTRESERKEIPELGVTKPWRQDVTLDREYAAQIKAIRHIEIRAFEKGYLQTAFVDEGRSIPAGQKMFQVRPMLIGAEFEKTKAEFEAAEIEYKNTKRLHDKKVVSKSELALSKAKLAKEKAALDIARTHLKLTTITAPFAGMVDRFRVRLGSLVDEGELLTTLSDISQLLVYFNVSESDYLNLKATAKSPGPVGGLNLRLANGQMYPHPGRLDTIEADFDSETGNVALRATFPNPDQLLRHGETGNVVMKDVAKNALVIPQAATFDVLDKRFVYLVNAKGVVEPREIRVDREIPKLFVVAKGLTGNDSVLLEGLGKVKKGEVIKPVPRQPAAVIRSLELEAH